VTILTDILLLTSISFSSPELIRDLGRQRYSRHLVFGNGLSVVVLFSNELERLFIRLFNLRWSSSLPGRFTAGDIGPGTQSIRN